MTLCFNTSFLCVSPVLLSFWFLLWCYMSKLCCRAKLLQRMLLGTAFLCWCLGDLGQLSVGGHCGLVSWMSSSIWKAFWGKSACGGQTMAILFDCGLPSWHSVAVPMCAFSNEFRQLMEYLYSGLSSVGVGAALPAGGFCPSPLSMLPLDWRSCL